MRTITSTGSAARLVLSMLSILPAVFASGCATSGSARYSPKLPAVAQSGSADAGAWHARQSLLVQRRYGIDVVGIRRLASGWMLEMKYRVLDSAKAAPFGNDHLRPFLVHEKTGAKLAVPSMENIGELRQSGTLEADRDYYMLFGNANQLVQSGDVVTVVVGNARIEGLIVE
jgi:hypothetical protein